MNRYTFLEQGTLPIMGFYKGFSVVNGSVYNSVFSAAPKPGAPYEYAAEHGAPTSAKQGSNGTPVAS